VVLAIDESVGVTAGETAEETEAPAALKAMTANV
jgi:hypothetical protein